MNSNNTAPNLTVFLAKIVMQNHDAWLKIMAMEPEEAKRHVIMRTSTIQGMRETSLIRSISKMEHDPDQIGREINEILKKND